MSGRIKAALGSLLFLVLAPGVVAGLIPWLITGRLMKLDKLGDGSLKIFDKVVFPVSRWIEDRLPPSYGLNLVAIAVKP